MRTAPGFCTLRAFTTWNTSTTPSILHRSMVVAMAQKPLRLTVSLQGRHSLTHTLTHALTHPTHSLTHSPTHSLTHLHTPLTHSLTFTHLTHSLTHTHSTAHMCTYSPPLHVHNSPAVYHSGTVSSPPLDFAHLINHISHSLQVRAAAVRGPVGDVELAHLMHIARLQGGHQTSH